MLPPTKGRERERGRKREEVRLHATYGDHNGASKKGLVALRGK